MVDQIEGEFFFDPQDHMYDNHFPGQPVVPGSVILHAFTAASKKEKWIAAPYAVERFRFSTFISPGLYSYVIDRITDGVKCELYHSGKLAVSGTIRNINHHDLR